MVTNDETQEIQNVIDRLADQFIEEPRDIIERIVAEEHARLAGCAVRAYVSVLVQRSSADRLRARRREADVLTSGMSLQG